RRYADHAHPRRPSRRRHPRRRPDSGHARWRHPLRPRQERSPRLHCRLRRQDRRHPPLLAPPRQRPLPHHHALAEHVPLGTRATRNTCHCGRRATGGLSASAEQTDDPSSSIDKPSNPEHYTMTTIPTNGAGQKGLFWISGAILAPVFLATFGLLLNTTVGNV